VIFLLHHFIYNLKNTYDLIIVFRILVENKIRLKYLFGSHFLFVADGPHFDRMFKMVLIFAIRVLFSPLL